MPTGRHYLDHNATTPLRPEARAAMLDAIGTLGNPSSVHAEGRAARAIVERAREQVAVMAGVDPARVHFTSGATEANNWALSEPSRKPAASADSHDAALQPVRRRGGALLPVGADGRLRDVASRTGHGILTLPAVNNETGVVHDLGALAAARAEAGVRIHADAVQAPGRRDLPALSAAADSLALSAHKMGGPAGVGALIAADPEPMLLGGGQEARRRAGTENLIGIAGFGAAAAALTANWREEAERIGALRDRLEDRLRDACPDARIYGSAAERAGNTTCIRMPGVPAETQVMVLDLAGVAVSAGSACSSGKVAPSHVLRAMGVGEDEAAEAIRISLGWPTAAADVEACIDAWTGLWRRKRAA